MNNMGKVFQIVLGGLVFGIGIKKILSLDEENESLKEVNRFLIEENEELKNTISEIDRTVTGMITEEDIEEYKKYVMNNINN